MKKISFILIALGFVTISAQAKDYQINKIASGLGVVWAMDFVSENEIIFTQRSGGIGLVNLQSKKVSYLKGGAKVLNEGQGGMLDVLAYKNWLYFTYAKEVPGGSATVLAKAKNKNNQITDWEDILITKSVNENTHHYGSRVVTDGQYLYVSIGDRGVRENAQDLTNHFGKILRLNLDGSVPKDNPFVGNIKASDEIWSYGHRNPQGLAWDKKTQKLWAIEHGPRGGDEINLIKKGANYGWPVISYGKEYWGPFSVGESTHKVGMEQPIKYYVPSIAPSDLVVYQGKEFKFWDDDLLTGALRAKHINKISLDESLKTPSEERLLTSLKQRIRALLIDKTGRIYFSTDQGDIYMIKKAKK